MAQRALNGYIIDDSIRFLAISALWHYHVRHRCRREGDIPKTRRFALLVVLLFPVVVGFGSRELAQNAKPVNPNPVIVQADADRDAARQKYLGPAQAAYQALDSCYKSSIKCGLACMKNDPPDDLFCEWAIACERGCQNCDSLEAAWSKDIHALQQFDIQQVEALADQANEDIARDERAIGGLGFSTRADDIAAWQKLSEDAQKQFEKDTKGLLRTVALEQLKAAVKAAGSLNPPKANALISKLRAMGIDDEELFGLIRKLAGLRGKPATAEDVNQFVELLGKYADVKDVDSGLDALSTVLSWAVHDPKLAILLSELRFATSSVYNNATRRVSRDQVEQLTSLSDKDLIALQRLNALLRAHVAELNAAKQQLASLSSAATDNLGSDWEAELQRERMKADVKDWPALIEKDKEIYRKHGVDPCTSAFFPEGCDQ